MNVGEGKFCGDRTMVALRSAHRSAFPKEPEPGDVFDGRCDLMDSPDALFIPLGREGGNHVYFVSRGWSQDRFKAGETVMGCLSGMQYRMWRGVETTTVSSGCWTSVRTMKVTRKGWYR